MTVSDVDLGSLTPIPPVAEQSDARRIGTLRAVLRRPMGVIPLTVFILIVAAALLAPVLGTHDPNAQDLVDRLQRPSWNHFLGTDELGRDEFARILAASKISLWAATQATLVGLVLGVPLGLAMGLLGGRVDGVTSRTFDSLQSIPPLILAIAIVAVLGRQLTPAMIAIGIVFSPTFYRVSRAAAATVATETYIEASRSIGQRTYKILLTHVLGNVGPALIVQISTSFAFGILAEAALSYLGLGVQPPSASLGSMLTTAANLLNTSPQLTIEPGVVIVILVLCISLVGDVLRDVTSGDRAA